MNHTTGFEQITGHADVLKMLARSLASDDFVHAYVFYGPEGVGKRTTARVFAQSVLCEKRNPDGSACGKCMSCRLFAADTNPDLRIVTADKNVIKVDSIRDMQSDIILNPMYSNRKVCIIEEADKMNAQSQNCLLKTLEEPPAHSCIILTLENPGKMLETIRSRVVSVYFGRNTFEEVRDYLETHVKGLKDASFMAHYAEGSIGKALKACAEPKFATLRESAADMALGMHGLAVQDTFDPMEFFDKNKESVTDILDIMTLIYRDILVYAESGNENLLINTDKKHIIYGIAEKIPARRLMNAIEAVEKTADALSRNASFPATMEVMLMRVQKELNDG